MKDELSSNKKTNSLLDCEKQVQLPYNVELLSILEDAVIITDENFFITYWNPAAETIYGWMFEQIMGQDVNRVLRTKFSAKPKPETLQDIINTGSYEDDVVQFTKKNFPLSISTKVVAIKDNNGIINGYISINRDTTRQKNIERKLERSYNILNSIVENTTDIIYLKSTDGHYIMANSSLSGLVGKSMSNILGKSDWDLFSYDEAKKIVKDDRDILKTGKTVTLEEELYSHVDGEVRNYLSTKGFYRGYDDNVLGIFGITRDITKLKTAEENIILNEQRYRSLFNKMTEGFALYEIIFTEDGKPVDYRFIDINPVFEDIIGLRRGDVVGKLRSEIIFEDAVDWADIYGEIAFTNESIHFDEYINALGKHYDVMYFLPAENLFAVLYRDITSRKIMEKEFKDTLNELRATNNELEQFDYVASHDLQEPLRTITSFLQLLKMRYGNKLDDDADEFIEFAVKGAARMHELINDLLTYSRVNKRNEEFVEVDMIEVLDKVKINLEILISEKRAVITNDPLPVITADKKQMQQLLQNLISNSIKYKSKKPPNIHISAEKEGDTWLFSVEDNGIGIEPEYCDRIFKIFQRLHGLEKYEGTGIGLAISKRIVERHGGNIWVNPEKGIEGTKFNFTIKEMIKR